MLRIPLPEYDGFALREACKGLPACALLSTEDALAFRGRSMLMKLPRLAFQNDGIF